MGLRDFSSVRFSVCCEEEEEDAVGDDEDVFRASDLLLSCAVLLCTLLPLLT